MDEQKSKLLGVLVSEELDRQLEAEAARRLTNKSSVVRQALAWYLSVFSEQQQRDAAEAVIIQEP